MEYKVLAYYQISPIEDPHLLVKEHKKFFEKLDFKGRIYISSEGINGQASGFSPHADQYMDWLRTLPGFQNIVFKVHGSDEHAFEKMTVKYREQLVAVRRPIDFEKAGEHVEPSRWKKMLEEKDENTILIDVRNDYESKVGHFEGAICPDLKTFREFPDYTKKLKEQRDPKKTRVMMYCTGGIRCEYFSSLMKEEGFDQVYQLDGGVINYGLKEGSDHWKGKLFVFDDRLTVPISEEAPETISCCSHCSAPCDTYINCANMDCNELFLCCPSCLEEQIGCCSKECQTKKRVRAYQKNHKPFRRLANPVSR